MRRRRRVSCRPNEEMLQELFGVGCVEWVVTEGRASVVLEQRVGMLVSCQMRRYARRAASQAAVPRRAVLKAPCASMHGCMREL